MSITQTIPKTTLPAGPKEFLFANTLQPWSTAAVVINRTGTPNTDPWLNNLTPADSLTLDIQASTDGGATWHDVGGVSAGIVGGVVTAKGTTVDQTGVSVGEGVLFPTGTQFKVITTATVPMTISGTVTYS